MPIIDRGGVRIFFEDLGEGPVVVLGHSILCSGLMWEPQVPRLAERFRVINVDQRGHGRSGALSETFDIYDMVDDVVAVLDEAGVEKAVWAGLSIGGMVALRAALRFPDRVRGLIIVDSHAGPETAYKKLKYRAMNTGAKIFGTRPFLPAIMPLMFGRTSRRLKPNLVGEWREKFAAVDVPSLGLAVDALIRRDSVVDRLPEISVPTLVLLGEEDETLPLKDSREISTGIPGASLRVLPKAGHLSSLEQPDAVAEEMLEFLDRFGEEGGS